MKIEDENGWSSLRWGRAHAAVDVAFLVVLIILNDFLGFFQKNACNNNDLFKVVLSGFVVFFAIFLVSKYLKKSVGDMEWCRIINNFKISFSLITAFVYLTVILSYNCPII